MDEAKIDGSEIELLSKEKDKRFAKGLCKIEIQSPGKKKNGSGFLCIFQLGIMEFVVGMFTNHHVLDEEKNYFMTRENYRYEITKDQIKRFWTNKDMDVTFVAFKKKFAQELKDNEGWHFFKVSDDKIAVGSSVTILQHPEGGDACVSRGMITLRHDDTLHHTASTLAGSSGSPLLDIDYRVFGIHKQGKYFLNDKEHGIYNIGTVIKCAIERVKIDSLSSGPERRSGLYSVPVVILVSPPLSNHQERGRMFSSSDNLAQEMKETYSFRGMSPVSMVFDRKQSVNWNTIESLLDYRDAWKKMVQDENSNAKLHFPRISLSLANGSSTMLVLYLKRLGATKISVYGGYHDDEDDKTFPLKLSMTVALFLSHENPGKPTCSIQQKVKMEKKGDKEWNKLLTFKNIDWDDLSPTTAPRAELIFEKT